MVQPIRTQVAVGGATAQAMSPSESRRCNSSSQEVAPPRAQSPSETGRCNLLCQEVAPPELKFRALPRGATTKLGLRALAERCNISGQEMHHLSSVFELWQKGATTPDREVHPPDLSLRALPGGATSPVKRCNRLIPEFRDLIVLSSKFELGWGL